MRDLAENSMRDLAETFTLNEKKAMLEPEPEDLDENEIEAMLELEPEVFDQSELGRRKYVENLGKATSILKHYLKHHNFGNTETIETDVIWKQLITFHLGQCYAMNDDYPNALLTFQKLKQENYSGVEKAYLTATILFLERDKDGLTSLREVVKELDEDNCPNKAFIESFLRHFDKSYKEADTSE